MSVCLSVCVSVCLCVCLCTQVFPCLLMSDLPLGVLEVPQFSVEVQRRDRIVSASAVAWTTICSLRNLSSSGCSGTYQ